VAKERLRAASRRRVGVFGRYGNLLIYMFVKLGRPANWPQIAAALEQAAGGDGSAPIATAPSERAGDLDFEDCGLDIRQR
jgi:hypothetical protein